jgi:medium-chain acyl-[acyl-carrier-protein] hydrolase
MNTDDSIYEKDYKINSLNMNTNKKLGLVGILGILQDVTGEHALRLGFGYEELRKRGFFWVLVRQKLRINSWPNWNDLVLVKTWTKPVFGIYAIREYEIFVNNQKIGDCSTTWMILDSETRKPKKIENSDNLFRPRTDYSLDYSAEKVSIPNEMNSIKTFEVRISDLDMNNHVNNIKYTQWILDSIPFTYHQRFMTKEYEINFSGETFLDDKIETISNIEKLESNKNHEVFFKVNRVTDSKTVFTARILTKEFE